MNYGGAGGRAGGPRPQGVAFIGKVVPPLARGSKSASRQAVIRSTVEPAIRERASLQAERTPQGSIGVCDFAWRRRGFRNLFGRRGVATGRTAT